jgi:CRISPR/Cas system endoribonuclease Cas6 (RAMP superfamily)
MIRYNHYNYQVFSLFLKALQDSVDYFSEAFLPFFTYNCYQANEISFNIHIEKVKILHISTGNFTIIYDK